MTLTQANHRTGSRWTWPLVAVAVVWIILAGALIAAGVAITHSSGVHGFDRTITSDVVSHRTPALDSAMKAVTWLGSWVAVVAAGVLLVVLCALRRLAWPALALGLVAWAGEDGGTTLAKHVVHRPRPPQVVWLVQAHGWSFPSGHASTALFIWSSLAVLLSLFTRRTPWRIAGWIPAALIVAAVAFSRIELGVHWTTDVLASLAFVALWLFALDRLVRRLGFHVAWPECEPGATSSGLARRG